ncbi:RNA polymerase sigma factor [Nannocystis pusilla]|uniref:RNA polymerase sigma factor n=1 Tax=Nannocystis pusilla TaxID=889268 RepID=UPI003B7FD7B0
MDPASDRELVDAWRQGDRAAGHALFDRYYEPVARFFFNKVDGDVARDLIQRTFLGCVEGLANFRGDGEFRSWLFGIAYRQLCRHYRGRVGERAVVDFEQLSVADCQPSPSQHAASGEELRLLLAALQRLPLDYQVVLELHYWESMTTDEIAAALGLPPARRARGCDAAGNCSRRASPPPRSRRTSSRAPSPGSSGGSPPSASTCAGPNGERDRAPAGDEKSPRP